MDSAVKSISVVIKGPDAIAGSILTILSIEGIVIAMIGATNIVSHKEIPTTKAILTGSIAKDAFSVAKAKVVPNAIDPITRPFNIPVRISRIEFFRKPFSFVENIFKVTANVCVATFPADPEIKGWKITRIAAAVITLS